jgi:hypothetical protein
MSDDNQDDTTQEEEDVVKLSKEDYEILNERSRKVDDLAEELDKYKNKEYNFRQLERSTEEEKAKIKGEVGKKEEALKKEKEEVRNLRMEMEKKHDDFVKDQLMATHTKTLDDMCGSDKELRERVEYEAKMIVGPMNNETQIKEKYNRAYLLATGSRPDVNPLNATGAISSNAYRAPTGKKYTDTPQGQGNYDRWFKKPPEAKPDSLANRHLYNQ